MNSLLDANVILRYLLDDIPEQAEQAASAVEAGAFTLPEIIAEVVYVLSGVYKVKKSEIRDVLTDLLNEISVTGKEVIIKALTLYAEHNLDYVDCILLARAILYDEKVLSFDKKLNKKLQIVSDIR